MFKLIAIVLALIATAIAQPGNCRQPPPNQAATINSTLSYLQYRDCVTLPGLIIRNFGNDDGILDLSNLTTITYTSNTASSRFGLVIDRTSLKSILLPNLESIQGPTITVTNNADLTTLNIPKSVTFAVGQNSNTNTVVFAGNPNLVNTVIGITSTGSPGGNIVIGGADTGVTTTTQGQDAVAGSVSFPFLVSANNIAIRTVGVNTNSIENRLSSVEFPSLTSLSTGFALINTSVQSLSVSQKVTVAGTIDIEFNDRLGLFVFNFTTLNQLIYANNGATAGNSASISAPDVKTGFFRIEDNPTLGSVSLDTLQYIGRLSIQRNPGLTTLYMPTAAFFQNYIINNNGADANRLNATLGAQVTNLGSQIQIQTNFFSDLRLNQLGNINGSISIINNDFTGGFYAQSSFATTGSFQFNNNKGAITVTDISGLNAASIININGNAGASGSSLLLTQLQALGAGVNTINTNTGYATLSFGQLVLVGSDNSSYVTFNTANSYPNALQINANSFTTISTVGRTSFTAPLFSITNNAALQTIDLSGLVQAGQVQITGNTALTNFTAPQLSCVGTLQLPELASPSTVRAIGLTRFYTIETPVDGTCAATIGSIMDTCAKVCYRCGPTPGGCYGEVTANSGLSAACVSTTGTSQTLPSTCSVRSAFQPPSNPATPVPYTAAGGLYPDPTVVSTTNNGGDGTTNNGGDGTTNNGGDGTTNNGAPTTGTTNNGATTGTTNNGGAGNTTTTNNGNGSSNSASMIQMTFVVVVSMTVFAALF